MCVNRAMKRRIRRLWLRSGTNQSISGLLKKKKKKVGRCVSNMGNPWVDDGSICSRLVYQVSTICHVALLSSSSVGIVCRRTYGHAGPFERGVSPNKPRKMLYLFAWLWLNVMFNLLASVNKIIAHCWDKSWWDHLVTCCRHKLTMRRYWGKQLHFGFSEG